MSNLYVTLESKYNIINLKPQNEVSYNIDKKDPIKFHLYKLHEFIFSLNKTE